MLAETEADGETYEFMTRVVDGILQGFRISRDMPGFLKLWYQQMCQAERASSSLKSPWFYVGQSQGADSLTASIEQQITPQQLLDVLDWIVATGVHQQALSIFLAGVSRGIKSDTFADAVCNKVFELSQLVDDSKSTSWAIALRWTTISRVLAWFPSKERGETWAAIHKSLGRVMKKGDIESAHCFEAFKCCCQAWSSMSPDDTRIAEPLSLLQTFSKRLAARVSEQGLPTMEEPADPATATDYDFAKGPRLAQYIAWYSRGHSRLAHLTLREKEAAPVVSDVATKLSTNSLNAAQSMWEALVGNDQVWQNITTTPDVVGRLTAALEESTKSEALPYSGGQKWLQLLYTIPSDAFTRQQRERVVAAVVGRAQTVEQKARNHADLGDWRCLLGLLLKLAIRPTFYEGMRFEDLTGLVDALCGQVLQGKPDDETCLEMIDRVTNIATAIFRQMSENVNERSVEYLREGTSLLSAAKQHISVLDRGSTEITTLPLRLTLMKCLMKQLSQSSSCSSNTTLSRLCSQIQESMSKLIASLINRWVNEKSSRKEQGMMFALYAAIDAAHSLGAEVDLTLLKSSKLRKLDESSHQSMMEGDFRGWTIQIFLRTYLPASVAEPLPSSLPPLDNVPSRLREGVMIRMVNATLKGSTQTQRFGFVRSLIANISNSIEGRHGQVMAVDQVVRQMIGE
jgi:nucleolar pre-ribosomal-associated protein 2